jgi:hypothetical protein
MGNVRTARALAVWLTVLLVAGSAWAQGEMSKVNRERALEILHVVSAELKKHYYDPKFHGVDWDAKVTETEQQIERERSFNMAMSHIAATLALLNDSHTFLIPPKHAYRTIMNFATR